MKWIGQHIWCWITRFKNKVYFEDRVECDNVVKFNGRVEFAGSDAIAASDNNKGLRPVYIDEDTGILVLIRPQYKVPGSGNTVADLGDDTSTVENEEIAGGIGTVTPTGNQTKPLDTAENIIANDDMGLDADGDSFEFMVVNEASATHKVTLSNSGDASNITLKGDMDVGAKTSATFRIVRDGSGIIVYRK